MENLLELFTSKDVLRPHLMKPIYEAGYVYATDAMIALRLDHLDCKEAYSRIDPKLAHQYKIEPIFRKDKMISSGIVTAGEVKLLLEKIGKIAVYERCESCQGTGVKVCECCKTELDCRSCCGSGQSAVEAGQKYEPFAPVPINGKHIRASDAEKLIAVLDQSGDMMVWQGLKKERALLFENNICMVAIMPLNHYIYK